MLFYMHLSIWFPLSPQFYGIVSFILEASVLSPILKKLRFRMFWLLCTHDWFKIVAKNNLANVSPYLNKPNNNSVWITFLKLFFHIRKNVFKIWNVRSLIAAHLHELWTRTIKIIGGMLFVSLKSWTLFIYFFHFYRATVLLKINCSA